MVSRWANGAGRKADVAAGEGWAVGFAWLDRDAPFSDLTGFDRTIMLVEGPGFALEVGEALVPVVRPFVPARFDGGAETHCRVAGPCRVLNVLTARGRLRHEVSVVGPGGTVAAGEVAGFAVALRGAGSVGGLTVGVLDTVEVDRPSLVADAWVAAVSIGFAVAGGSP